MQVATSHGNNRSYPEALTASMLCMAVSQRVQSSRVCMGKIVETDKTVHHLLSVDTAMLAVQHIPDIAAIAAENPVGSLREAAQYA